MNRFLQGERRLGLIGRLAVNNWEQRHQRYLSKRWKVVLSRCSTPLYWACVFTALKRGQMVTGRI